MNGDIIYQQLHSTVNIQQCWHICFSVANAMTASHYVDHYDVIIKNMSAKNIHTKP